MSQTGTKNLHLKAGRYYYVKRVGGKVRWIALSTDQHEALEQCQKLQGGEDVGALAATPPSFEMGRQITYLHTRARDRAKTAGIYFDLTIDDVKEMADENNWHCAVTGIRFNLDRTNNAHARAYAPSIDRKNCSQGYTRRNCRLVCVAVNVALNEWGESVLRRIGMAFVRKAETAKLLENKAAAVRTNDGSVVSH